MTVDIFSEGSAYQDPSSFRGTFFRFTNVGDQIQGTIVGAYEGVDSFNNEQFIYVLKDASGSYHNVALRKLLRLNTQVHTVRVGQIIGFRYNADIPYKRSPTGKRKEIQLWESPTLVDTDWVAKNPAMASRRVGDLLVGSAAAETTVQTQTQTTAPGLNPVAPVTQTGVAFSVPASAAPAGQNTPTVAVPPAPAAQTVAVPPATPDVATAQFNAIRTLARTKGIVPASADDATTDAAIAAVTGMPLTAANLTPSIIKLTQYQG